MRPRVQTQYHQKIEKEHSRKDIGPPKYPKKLKTNCYRIKKQITHLLCEMHTVGITQSNEQS